jgi:hypothetical protein
VEVIDPLPSPSLPFWHGEKGQKGVIYNPPPTPQKGREVMDIVILIFCTYIGYEIFYCDPSYVYFIGGRWVL